MVLVYNSYTLQNTTVIIGTATTLLFIVLLISCHGRMTNSDSGSVGDIVATTAVLIKYDRVCYTHSQTFLTAVGAFGV